MPDPRSLFDMPDAGDGYSDRGYGYGYGGYGSYKGGYGYGGRSKKTL